MTFKPTRPRTQVIELEWPFEFEGRSYSALTFRRPRAPDLQKLNEGPQTDKGLAERSLRMIADLAEVSPAVIDCLDPEDIASINAWLEPILDPKGQRSSTQAD